MTLNVIVIIAAEMLIAITLTKIMVIIAVTVTAADNCKTNSIFKVEFVFFCIFVYITKSIDKYVKFDILSSTRLL